ncbi:MAG: pentapeptide repeat-containing protein [Bryobacteraceae bacterium]
MLVRENRRKPANWREHLHNAPARWALPFHALEWAFQWMAYFLSQWALLEVLEYLGSLSVLVAVIFYFAESGDRRKQKHYQAWQVINTAQGKGGSGGRIEALNELNEDGVPLVGVDVSGAFLQGVRLIKAGLSRSNFETADLRDAILRASDFRFANLHSANLRGADASGANFTDAALMDSDLTGANLSGADLTAADLSNADLRNADLRGVHWQKLKAVTSVNIYGLRNAPPGFVDWAMMHGAKSDPSEE